MAAPEFVNDLRDLARINLVLLLVVSRNSMVNGTRTVGFTGTPNLRPLAWVFNGLEIFPLAKRFGLADALLHAVQPRSREGF